MRSFELLAASRYMCAVLAPILTLDNNRNHRMDWDQTLLRKYNSTGHFRLLNQTRTDLRNNPLDRDPVTAELRPPQRGRRRGSYQARQQEGPCLTESARQVRPVPSSTFRDRLSIIEMR